MGARLAVSGFLLIIVGTAPLPSGLHASLHNGQETLLFIASESAPQGAIQFVIRQGRIEDEALANDESMNLHPHG